MSNRRNLKKQINESMGLLFNDCILYKVFSKNANIEKADALIQRIVDTQADFLSRANSTEGKNVKNRVKVYYKKLTSDLKNQVNEIGQEIQQLD